jgi:transposase-like protein/DNA-directed RNA polymerase subunit RPC12/RpoP
MIQTDLNSFSYKKGSLVPWCKRCEAQHWYRDGKNKEGIQRYRCRNCGFRFVWSSDMPNRRVFSHIVTFAVKLYTDLRKAISLRGIAELLKEIFGVVVSHEAVRKWIRVAKKTLYRREMPPATVWHADETYIKIKGCGYWLWIVYCADTHYILGWHISDTHLFKHAKHVIQMALHNNHGVRPKKIITDGLWQYPVAIYKVMGWSWREHKKRHIIDSGIGKNAIIERLNREIKRRMKWFSTFQSVEGAKAFFGLWFYHYNQRKSTHKS